MHPSIHPNPALVLVAIFAMLSLPWSLSAAGLLVADGGFGGVLQVVEHKVEASLNNGIAVTNVTQVFENQEDRQVEALYTFPVPKGASVSNFSMWINGKEMVGEVVEKKRARQIYESYKRQNVDPGLLEQIDFKTFEMRIFPIAARARQQVQITYYQELDFDHDWVNYVYPLATVTRSDVRDSKAGVFSFQLNLNSLVPIAELSCPSHPDDVAIATFAPGYRQVTMELADADINRDVVVAAHLERPKTGIDVIAHAESGDDGYLMLTVTAGQELAAASPGMDYVFVLDVSGSMAQDGKLGLSRDSVLAFLQALRPEDRFEVITFNNSPNPLFGELRNADSASHNRAGDHIGAQRPRGGTFLKPAIETAYRYRNDERQLNVVVLSDGLTDKREERRTLVDAIAARPAGTRVFCVGVGNEVNRPLLTQLARDAGGLSAFISLGDNLKRQATAFHRKLAHPAVSDVRIDFQGARVYEVEPAQLGNLFHGAPLRLYARYRGAGSVDVVLSGRVEGQDIGSTITVDLPDDEPANPELQRMWASRRLQRLVDEVDAGQRGDGRLAEIVRLGELYSIVSEYTSFLVLENENEYKRWKIERRNQLRTGRERSRQAQLALQLERMRDSAVASIGPVQRRSEQPATPARVRPQAQPVPAQPRSNGPRRSFDLDLGGGAAGPIVLLFGIGLVAATRRR
jgi:Ca-activated chloride channel family protein